MTQESPGVNSFERSLSLLFLCLFPLLRPLGYSLFFPGQTPKRKEERLPPFYYWLFSSQEKKKEKKTSKPLLFLFYKNWSTKLLNELLSSPFFSFCPPFLFCLSLLYFFFQAVAPSFFHSPNPLFKDKKKLSSLSSRSLPKGSFLLSCLIPEIFPISALFYWQRTPYLDDFFQSAWLNKTDV